MRIYIWPARAAVLLAVAAACSRAAPPAAVPTKERAPIRRYDLVARGYDHNGFILNPQWGWSFNKRHKCPNSDIDSDPTTCSWRFSEDRVSSVTPCNTLMVDPDFSNDWSTTLFGVTCSDSPLLFTGHVNWGEAYHGAVTYQGWLSWDQYSHSDSDYNFLLETEDKHSPSPGFVIGVEIYQRELRNFSNRWLRDLGEKAVIEKDPEDTKSWLKTKQAVLTGLLGIDAEHMGPRFLNAELHPVYAMAIRTTDSGADTDVWVLLVRHAGNEGFCSHRDRNHVLQWPDQRYQVELPILCGKSEIQVTSSFCGHGTGTPEVSLIIDLERDKPVGLASVLVPQEAIVEGEVRFHCRGSTTATAADDAARLEAVRASQRQAPPVKDRRSSPVEPRRNERARKQIAQVCGPDQNEECVAFAKQAQGKPDCGRVVVHPPQFASVATPSSEPVTCSSGLPLPFDSRKLASLARTPKPSAAQMTPAQSPAPPEEDYCNQRAATNQTAAELCSTLRRAKE